MPDTKGFKTAPTGTITPMPEGITSIEVTGTKTYYSVVGEFMGHEYECLIEVDSHENLDCKTYCIGDFSWSDQDFKPGGRETDRIIEQCKEAVKQHLTV